jgi:hypothetical protein
VRRALPYAAFALLTLAVFHGVLLQGRTLVTVSVLEQQLGRAPQQPAWLRPERPPVRVADNGALLPMLLRTYNDGLHAGRLDLWNPRQFCGYPLAYDTMVHPFYPPQLLLHRIFSWETAYGWILLIHFFASGAALFHLLRALGRSEAASTFGGLAWMLLGFNSLWFSTQILLAASVFGPLALLALHRGMEGRRLPFAGLAGAAFGMVLLGSHPQHALLLFLFLLAWIAAHPDRRFAVRFGLAFALLAVGVGLAAVLGRLDSLANGWRVPGADLASLYKDAVFPHLFGLVIGKLLIPETPALAYELMVHAGLAVTTLAVAGAVRGWKEPRTRFLAAAAALALLAAFASPLARLLNLIPILNSSPPTRWIFVAGLAIALLAARGLDALRDGVGRLPWILTGAFALLFLARLGHLSDGATIETLAGFALAAAAAFAAKKDVRAGAGLAVAALLVDLLPPFYFAHNWPADAAVLRETPAALRDTRGPWRGTGVVGATPSETDYYERELVAGNPLLSFLGVENVAGFEALMPSAYVRYARASGAHVESSGRFLLWTRFDSPLLDAAGLRYLFLPPALDPGPRFTRLSRTDRLAVYENPRAFPRAWIVGTAVPTDDPERLLRSTDLRRAALVEPGTLPDLKADVRGAARRLDDGSFEVESDGPGLLVVSETWDAGWSATVDGAAAPVLRANLAFRAVAVPAGSHRVAFSFRPVYLTQGLLGSAAFLLIALGWPMASRRVR